ncbi:MAG: hypothetical protein Q9222_000940 [Ikaeria aurantiellina]
MVYYFTSRVAESEALVYVGKDKFETNGQPQQFHADNLSSAHVYLRLKPGQEWDQLPSSLIEDCAQLTKANSIEGNKKDNITIIYTPWSNLLKNASMATGQVSFREQKRTRTILVPTRLNPVINRLMKTRTVASADGLFAEKEQHLSELRAKAREKAKETRKEEDRLKKERKDEKYKREHAYEDLMKGDEDEEGGGKRSNQDGWDDDDFIKPFKIRKPEVLLPITLPITYDGSHMWVTMQSGEQALNDWLSNTLPREAQQTWQRNDGSPPESSPEEVIFRHGTSYTVCCWWNLLALVPSKSCGSIDITIYPGDLGFLSWKYLSTEDDLIEGEEQWPDPRHLGAIEFATVCEGWDEIQTMLEDERPMPLFTLPAEIRHVIYDYAKFGLNVQRVVVGYQCDDEAI